MSNMVEIKADQNACTVLYLTISIMKFRMLRFSPKPALGQSQPRLRQFQTPTRNLTSRPVQLTNSLCLLPSPPPLYSLSSIPSIGGLSIPSSCWPGLLFAACPPAALLDSP